MTAVPQQVDVVIIGAGPSGAVAGALLKKRGYRVAVFEKEHFPRFSIGESLLPHCMEFIEEAGLLSVVRDGGFQFKNGAAFAWGERNTFFNFEEKFTEGPGTTFQVERARFDQLLADEAAALGVEFFFGHSITACEFPDSQAEATQTPAMTQVSYRSDSGLDGDIQCRYLLDASGFGRVLPRLLDLEVPSDLAPRHAAFTHVNDRITDPEFDRNKVLITVHPEERDIWYWLIPLAGGKCSTGVAASPEQMAARGAKSPRELVQAMVAEVPSLQKLLSHAEWVHPANQLSGYSRNVKHLSTHQYALLGNAGEFLDPIFSSGITIALRSSSMAAALVDRQLSGESVDWSSEYDAPLREGVETFRVFVDAWYDGRFQDIIFYPEQRKNVREMISSVMAGYAWDKTNPFVAEPARRMRALAEFCATTEG